MQAYVPSLCVGGTCYRRIDIEGLKRRLARIKTECIRGAMKGKERDEERKVSYVAKLTRDDDAHRLCFPDFADWKKVTLRRYTGGMPVPVGDT